MARPADRETLDTMERLDPGELAENLSDLAQVKRWLGLYGVLRQTLAAGRRGEIRVLDVATGGGDVPEDLRRAAGSDLRVQVIGVDLHPQVILEARRRLLSAAEGWAGGAVALVRADGLRLPLARDSVDVALCSLSLHHFAWEEACTLLREMARVARERLLVIDFLRSRRAYATACLLARLLGSGHRLSRLDGPLSIRRAYTLPELRQLALAAGLQGATVRARAPFLGVIEAGVRRET